MELDKFMINEMFHWKWIVGLIICFAYTSGHNLSNQLNENQAENDFTLKRMKYINMDFNMKP